MPLKVMTIVGTRPELIKLSRVIAQLDAHSDHVLVHTGQNYDYELNEIFFKDLSIRKPDHFLSCGKETAAATIAAVIVECDRVFEQVKPDALLIYGDTNSCLAVIPAKRRKIPIFHMEAGNRCFDQRVPEEINRKMVDHLSDINMPLTEHGRRYLMNEGIRPETIIKTGSCMPEVLRTHAKQIEASDVLKKLSLRAREYFVVSAHREENVDTPERLRNLLLALNGLVSEYGKRVIVSTHPRTRKRLQELVDAPQMESRVEFVAPLGFYDYVHLQTRAYCVLSDSGTISEEAAILNFPAVSLRAAHERPEGMDAGAFIMSPLVPERIFDAVKIVVQQTSDGLGRADEVDDYQDSDVSHKVVRVIQSYTDYVNRTVWHKHE